MKCKNCGSEFRCAGNVKKCPFCNQDCTLPPEEVEVLYRTAENIPASRAEEKAAAYLRAAEYGYAPAEYALGLCYEEGSGLPQSRSVASVWHRMAAEQGHPEACYRLAVCLRDRYRGTAQADNAYFWLRVAAELGSSGARCMLGDCYENGEGFTANPLRAAYWYTLAAEAGDFRAAYRISRLYHNGSGVRQNPAYEKYYAEMAYNGGIRAALRMLEKLDSHVFSEVPAKIEIKNRNEDRFELGYRAYGDRKYQIAVLLYELAAKDGYPRAQNNLGVCYEKGQGVSRDEATAAVWYRLAAEGGYDNARLNLGDCYREGRGVEKNEAAAFACYLAAAQNGYAPGQFLVGECYFNAELVDRNLPDAMKWYEKSALQGYGPAMEKVNAVRADMTELYNRGVDAYGRKEYPDAVKFYTIAAEFGHRGAQCNLGFCYQNGQGCEKNARTAVYYYEKAAAQESGVAEFNLATCYLRGEGGLPIDCRAAADLLTRAASHGVEAAAPLLSDLTARKKKRLARRVYAVSATILSRGESFLPDALKIRRIAAEMGNPRAMFALGCHYEFGFGLPEDEKEAAAWYARAYRAGYRSGSRMKSTILKMMRKPSGFRREPAPAEKPAETAPAAAE